jgi:hypothetical protein
VGWGEKRKGRMGRKRRRRSGKAEEARQEKENWQVSQSPSPRRL